MRNRMSRNIRRHSSQALGLILTAALVTLLGLVFPSAASAVSGSVSQLAVTTEYDGASVPNAVDPDQHNGIVATNDTVAYRWSFATSGVQDAVFTQTLPEGWTWQEDSLAVLDARTSLYSSSYTISDDGRTLTATISTPTGGAAAIQLGPLMAVPGGTVEPGSSYTPQLQVTDGVGTQQVTGAATVVAGEPAIRLAKDRVTQNGLTTMDFGSGPESARYVDYLVTIDSPSATEVGAIDTEVAVPFTVQESWTAAPSGFTTGIELVATSPGVTASVQSTSGTTAGITVTAVPATFPATPITLTVRLGVPRTEVEHLSTATVATTLTNQATVQAAMPDGTALPPASDSVAGTVWGTAATGAAAYIAKDLYRPTDPAVPPTWGVLPRSVPSAWTPANSQEVADGSYLMAQVRGLPAVDAAGNATAMTDPEVYDFWDPAQQTIVEGAALYVGNANGIEFEPGEYTVAYTNDGTSADPSAATWYPTIAAAGGADQVRGIRVGMTGPYQPGTSLTSGQLAISVPMQVHTGRAATVSDTGLFYQGGARVGSLTRNVRIAGGVLRLDAALDPGDESIVSSEEIGYTLTPAVVAPQNASGPVTVTGLTVVATLPPSLISVDTAAVDPAWSVQQTGDLQDGFVLTFTYVGAATASSGTALPPIVFTATSSIQAPASGSIIVPAVISADDNDQPVAERTATVTSTVSQADVTTIQKAVDGPTQVPVGTSELAWQLGWYNYRSVSVGASAVVDVLPFDGDGRGNDFAGTLSLTDVELIGDAADGTTLSYATADPADVLADPWSGAITWTPLPADPSEVTGITAVRADIADLRVTYAGGIRITATIDDAAVGDVFVNSDIAHLEDFPGHVLGPVTAQPITVVGATITGQLWWDRNRDGVRDGDEVPVADIPVQITTPSGGSHRTSTDGAGGYRVDGLGAGEHTVSVDSSVLGTLGGLEFTAQGAGPDRSVDSDVATTGAAPVTVGVGTEHQVDAGLVDTQFTVSKSVRSAPGSDSFIEADASDGLMGRYTWGDTADWRIVVRNTGHTDLSTLVLTDPGLAPTTESADTCRALTEDGVTLDRLAPDESATVECSSPVTVPHTNVAVATDPVTEQFAEDSAAITVATPAAVGLRKLVESAPGSGTFIEADDSDGLTGAYQAGDRVAWRLVVTNTGNAPLSDVVVSDPGLAGADGAEPSEDAACRDLATGHRIDSLAPGDSVTLTCTAVEQESRVNTAEVTAQWPDAPAGVEDTVTAEDDAAITVTPAPTAPGSGGSDRPAGDGGGLAVTGAATLGVLATAAALTLAGLALLRTRRRAQHRS